MSYVGPDSDGYFDGDGDGPRRPRRFSGGPLTVALAALVPTALAGWLIWQVVGGPGENEPAKTLPAASQSSTVRADTTSPSPSKSDDGKKGDGSPSATPSKPKSKPPASSSRPAGSGPLKGKVVVIDPGHNPGNYRHAAEINRLVDIGTNRKECDTTGTSTNAGYTEAQFTLDVSRRLRTLLQQQGATVELTQDGDRPWGPCVDERGPDRQQGARRRGGLRPRRRLRGGQPRLPCDPPGIACTAGAADTRRSRAPRATSANASRATSCAATG